MEVEASHVCTSCDDEPLCQAHTDAHDGHVVAATRPAATADVCAVHGRSLRFIDIPSSKLLCRDCVRSAAAPGQCPQELQDALTHMSTSLTASVATCRDGASALLTALARQQQAKVAMVARSQASVAAFSKVRCEATCITHVCAL